MTKPTEQTTQSDNPLGMSDDEIMNMNSPSQLIKAPESEPPVNSEEPPVNTEEETATTQKPEVEEEESTSTGKVEENSDNSDNTSVNTDETDPAKTASKTDTSSTEETNQSTQSKDGKAKPEGEKPASGEKPEESNSIDYESFYKAVMKPIKANGKTVEIRTPEEAVQLMQMGANYTRKMQDIAPHRKTLLMLENNGLLDQDKLAFLIDLDKKNPDAIKKLIRESGIDPMDFDPNEQLNYQKGNHAVSDEEANFRSILDDVKSTPEGMETLRTINDSWDQASKEYVWANPDVISVINEQRNNGIYDRIAGEVERQRTLGKIPSNVSFLQAYKVVGDAMQAQNAFADLASAGSEPVQPQAKQPIATKAAAPKPQVTNSEKANAASQPRHTSTQKASRTKNPLELSDEEFMKQFENRL
uniref:Tail length tape measure protein n=1 Tax=Erwinia phage Fifi051 TaxID=3238787 RepID=A0AB39ACG8_9CAUD